MIEYARQIKVLMDSHKLTLCVAESITTGNIQAAIGSVSGSSTFFEGGMTVYSRKQKVKHLGVNDLHAQEVNSVSARVAEEMARGICLRYDCDIGVGTTGYAEPYPQENAPIPCAYFAVWRRHRGAQDGDVIAAEFVTGEDLSRVQMQRFVTQRVLECLVRYLEAL